MTVITGHEMHIKYYIPINNSNNACSNTYIFIYVIYHIILCVCAHLMAYISFLGRNRQLLGGLTIYTLPSMLFELNGLRRRSNNVINAVHIELWQTAIQPRIHAKILPAHCTIGASGRINMQATGLSLSRGVVDMKYTTCIRTEKMDPVPLGASYPGIFPVQSPRSPFKYLAPQSIRRIEHAR